MKQRLTNDLNLAMKAKDTYAKNAIKNIKTEISKLETAKNGKEQTDSDIIQLIKKMIKRQTESAEIYKSQNKLDLYEIELKEIEVLSKYVPVELTKEQVLEKVQTILMSNNITETKQFGQAMKLCMNELKEVSDGKVIGELIKNNFKIMEIAKQQMPKTDYTYKINNRFIVEFEFSKDIEIHPFVVQQISKPKFKLGEWEEMKITFADPVCPSTSQQLFKLIDLSKNSKNKILFSFYIKSLKPSTESNEIIEEWYIQVKNIVSIDFGNLDYTNSDFQHPYMIITPANCILNY